MVFLWKYQSGWLTERKLQRAWKVLLLFFMAISFIWLLCHFYSVNIVCAPSAKFGLSLLMPFLLLLFFDIVWYFYVDFLSSNSFSFLAIQSERGCVCVVCSSLSISLSLSICVFVLRICCMSLFVDVSVSFLIRISYCHLSHSVYLHLCTMLLLVVSILTR